MCTLKGVANPLVGLNFSVIRLDRARRVAFLKAFRRIGVSILLRAVNPTMLALQICRRFCET
jgi:hypothetical protein